MSLLHHTRLRYFYSFWTKCISPAGRARDYLSINAKKNLYFWKSLWSSHPKNEFLMSKGRSMVAFSCQKVGRWSQVYNKSCWKYNWSHCTNFYHHKKFEKWIHEEQFTVRFLMNLTPKYHIIFCMSFQVLYWKSNFPEISQNYPPILRKEVTIITHPYCFVRWSTHDALIVKLHAWNSCVWAYFKKLNIFIPNVTLWVKSNKTWIFTWIFFKAFSTNVPVMDKPGNLFLLAKCFKNTWGRVKF